MVLFSLFFVMPIGLIVLAAVLYTKSINEAFYMSAHTANAATSHMEKCQLFGDQKTKIAVHSINSWNYRKQALWAIICAVVLQVVTLGIFLLTFKPA